MTAATKDVYQLSIVGVSSGQYVENIQHYLSSNADDTDPLTKGGAYISGWQTNNEALWLACLPQDYTLMGYKMRRVFAPSIGTLSGPTAIVQRGVPGTMTGEGVVSNVGPLITLGFFDPGGTKRKWETAKQFMPGFVSGMILENVIQAALLAALNAFIAQWVTPITGGATTAQLCAWRRAGTEAFLLPSGDVSLAAGTQRRRVRPTL